MYRVLSLSAVLAALVVSSPAKAWESEKKSTTHTFPITNPPIGPVGVLPDSRSVNGMRRYGMQILHGAIGGFDANGSDDIGSPGIYVCDHSPNALDDLSVCKMATPGSLEQRSFGWLTARQALNADGPAAEHYVIAQLAAKMAGLLDRNLFDRFWVRYPSHNEYVGSRIQDLPPKFLVAQSLIPADFEDVQAHATRGISLLELSQLPDFSHSANDWLQGNERCPIQGTEGAYSGGTGTANTCHDFGLTMGAINITHFAPLNREMYNYYHGLAKDQMRRCAPLLSLIHPFYEMWNDPTTSYERPWSARDTEAHECERFAFVYEMVAQHFLQDGWSTGHMWKRWGYPRYSDFPQDVLLPGEVESPRFPASNGPARRAAIALSLAALSGTMHGAKAVVYGLLRQHLGSVSAARLEQTGLLNDPLSGPEFTLTTLYPLTTTRKTSWKSEEHEFSGAGDMFWNPPAPRASVFRDAIYSEQRTRLLRCAASSMLEVYNMPGPNGEAVVRAHGAPGVPELPTIDPSGDECWNHWATNASMLGSLGPVDLLRALYGGQAPVSNLPVSALLFGVANGFILTDRGVKTPSFPQGKESSEPAEEERILDRKRFFVRLNIATNSDFLNISSAFFRTYWISDDGVESARGVDPDGNTLTLLGVPPMSDTPTPAPARPRDVDYVDPADRLLDDARRVFWRADIANVCRESVQNNAAGLLNLRSRCVQASASGGDSDACTACVDLAELHIPTCLRAVSGTDTGMASKCSALGTYSAANPPVGLPSWWFNRNERAKEHGAVLSDGSPSDIVNCGFPSYLVAFHWCTGTPTNTEQLFDVVNYGSLHAERVLTSAPQTTIACSEGTRVFRGGVRREALAQLELNSTGDNLPFLRPMVTAFEEEFSEIPSPEPCSSRALARVESSLDSRVADAVAPAKLWDNQAWGVSELDSPGRRTTFARLKVPRCGVVQRISWWNRDCTTALTELHVPSTAQPWNPATGRFHFEADDGASCFERDARVLVTTCPASMVCTASGECAPSATREQAFVRLLDEQ